MHKRVVFQHRVLPYLLVAPQLAITLVFFIWPAGQALFQSVLLEDAFGLSTQFVWFENFERLFTDRNYLHVAAGDGRLLGRDGRARARAWRCSWRSWPTGHQGRRRATRPS